MDRCWEELYGAGKALAKEPHTLREIVNDVALDFELPRSPEAEAMRVFLDGLCGALEDQLLALEEPLPKAAE